jgi:uncharacterized coiled-coil DUF342 family protein
MDYPLYKDIGIVAVVAIPLFFLIKWIAEEFKAQLIREHAERLRWADIIQKFQECITQHTEKADAFHKQVNEQHTQMIEALGRINGYKKKE